MRKKKSEMSEPSASPCFEVLLDAYPDIEKMRSVTVTEFTRKTKALIQWMHENRAALYVRGRKHCAIALPLKGRFPTTEEEWLELSPMTQALLTLCESSEGDRNE